MTQVNTDNQTASSLDFSSPTRRKRDDIVMEADKVNTVTNDDAQLKGFPSTPLRDLLGIWKWSVKYPDYIDPDYKNYSNGRAVRELDWIEEKLTVLIDKAVLDGQIEILKKLPRQSHRRTGVNTIMCIKPSVVNAMITELQTKRKAL